MDELVEVLLVARVGRFALRAAEELGRLECRPVIFDDVSTAKEAMATGVLSPDLILIEPVVWLLDEELVRGWLQKARLPSGMLCMGSNGQVGFIPAGKRSGYMLLSELLAELRARRAAQGSSAFVGAGA